MKSMGPMLPGTKQVLLGFNEGDHRQREIGYAKVDVHVAHVHQAFLPRGMIIWGATEETLLYEIKVGNQTEVAIDWAPIPARYFETGRSFEEIQRLADAGELDLSLDARQHLEMNEASPGTVISVHLSGPYDRVCLWGTTYAKNGRAFRRARVQKLEASAERPECFTAQLDEITLSGPMNVLDVQAPDAATAASLLVGLSQRGFH